MKIACTLCWMFTLVSLTAVQPAAVSAPRNRPRSVLARTAGLPWGATHASANTRVLPGGIVNSVHDLPASRLRRPGSRFRRKPAPGHPGTRPGVRRWLPFSTAPLAARRHCLPPSVLKMPPAEPSCSTFAYNSFLLPATLTTRRLEKPSLIGSAHSPPSSLRQMPAVSVAR